MNVLDLCPQLTTMKVVLFLCISAMIATAFGRFSYGGTSGKDKIEAMV